MKSCTFFGHRECYDLDVSTLKKAIEELIVQGVTTFYVGNQGHFDNLVLTSLKKLKTIYTHISFAVVLAYLPAQKVEQSPYQEHSIYPEGLENCPPRFAIERRNKWMIEQSNFCLCYVNHTWGGAYAFVKKAKTKGLVIHNLGSIEWS